MSTSVILSAAKDLRTTEIYVRYWWNISHADSVIQNPYLCNIQYHSI